MYVIDHHVPVVAANNLKSALRSPTHPRIYDVSFDDDYLHVTAQQPLSSQDSRYSRSMGNNLDSVHINGAASRSIAALDVLPRNQIIYSEQQAQHPTVSISQCGNFTQILREIKLRDSRSAKSAIFKTHLEALNLDFYEFWQFSKAQTTS